MKHLLALIFTLVGMTSMAAETEKSAAKNTMQFTLGMRSLYGIYGLSYERMLDDNLAIHYGGSVDFIGPVQTLGLRYYGESIESTSDVWSKCMFLFACDTRYYGGLAVQDAPSFYLTSTSNGVESTYDIGPRIYAIPYVGVKQIMKNNVVFDFVLSHKSLLSKSEMVSKVGPDVQKHHDDFHAWEQGVGFGFSVGYMF
jgi:hypothetical protein